MKTNLLICATTIASLAVLAVCGTARAVPLAPGMKFGIDLGPTPTNIPGNDWNDISALNGGIAAGSVINLAGAVIDGVSITTANSQFSNNDGTNNWVGLSTNVPPGNAPPEFVETVVTDIQGNFSLGDGTPYTVTVDGLNAALRYNIWAVATANFTPIDTVTIIGAATSAPSAISRPDAQSQGLFHSFTQIEPSASGEIRIEVVDTSAGTNPILNAVLFEVFQEPPSMTLEVNTVTGLIRLIHSGGNLDVKGYQITSPNGSLNPSGWSSLQEAGFQDKGSGTGNTNPSDGIGWEQLGNGTSNFVAEYNLQSSSIFGSGGTTDPQSFGNLFTPHADQDLEFELRLANGASQMGIVEYISTGLAGDHNSDGKVDAADYVVWRDTLINGANGYSDWKANFGLGDPGSGSALGETAVPEPTTFVCLAFGMALVGVRFFNRRGGCLMRRKSSRIVTVGLTVAGLWIAISPHASAQNRIDRLYRLGDEDNDNGTPAAGLIVGSTTSTGDTFDSTGTLGTVQIVDLPPSGAPVYASTTGRPFLVGSGLGVEFDGSDDYISGPRLGLPSTSISATGSPNPHDYTGLVNRGFQLWVKPNLLGAGTSQSIVADTNQHSVRISSDDTWVLRYNNIDVDSGAAVAFNQWHHVMVVRPFGAGGGGRLYVDGVAVAAQLGGYDGADNTPLVIGANTGAAPGTADYFRGIVDDLEMFVLGSTTSGTPVNYGTFNFLTDNEFAAATLSSFVPGDTNGDGLVRGDGSGALGVADDVKTFVNNWRRRNLVNDVQIGDVTSPAFGDFNFDGITDFSDWLLLRQNYSGFGASLDLEALLNGTTAVPEPSSLALLAIAAVAGGASRARRRFRQSLAKVFSWAALCCILFLTGGVQADPLVAGMKIGIDFGPMLTTSWNNITPTQGFGPSFNVGSIAAGSVINLTGTVVDGVSMHTFNDGPITNGTFSNVDGTDNFIGLAANGGNLPLEFVDSVTTDISGNVNSGPEFLDTPYVLEINGLDPSLFYNIIAVTAAPFTPIEQVTIVGASTSPPSTIVRAEAVAQGLFHSFIGIEASASGQIQVRVVDVSTSANPIINAVLITATGISPILTIDRETGAMSLNVNAPNNLNVIGYEILSNGGALNPGSWLSIADNYDANDGGEVDANYNWIKFTLPNQRDNLAEAQHPDGSGVFFPGGGSGTNIDLGTPWLQSPTEDVTMRLALADNTFLPVAVQYAGNDGVRFKLGDLNFDGDVDEVDWNILKPLFRGDLSGKSVVEQYRAGNLAGVTGVGAVVDWADIQAFAVAFDAANGTGAFASLSNTVPEPSAMILLLIGVCIVMLRRVR